MFSHDGGNSRFLVVSTALWTGVYLSDILDYVKPIPRKAKYVIFEGADDLPNGPYGTSQKISLASRRDQGMLIGMFVIHAEEITEIFMGYSLAWAMNGLPLEPDHGFPVRVVIPGQIGGRMVKVGLSNTLRRNTHTLGSG